MPEITETPVLRGKTMVRDIDIPAVRERNPDPKSGPRLAVKEFRLQGLVEYPELGITRDALNRLVENIRRDLMAEDKILPEGYTIKEIGEITDLLVDIEDKTRDRHVTPLELQRLVWLVREQRANRGIHLGQIEAIADQITAFYRERGFFLAKAFIPKQEVRDGIVSLTLLLGVLGEVNVQGNSLYATDAISKVFDDLLSQPVTNENIEERLYLLNDYPGLVVDGYFVSGYQVGDSKLNVNVKQEDRVNAKLRIDNHGADETGRYRSYADVQLNNPFGLADKLQVSAMLTTSPANTTYWRALYEANLFSPRWKGNISTSTNQYVVDQSLSDAPLKIDGEVKQERIAVKYLIKRSRINNYHVELAYDTVTSDIDINDSAAVFLDEKVNNVSLAFYVDSLNEKSRILNQTSLKYTSGEFDYGQGFRSNKQYDFYNLDYTFMTFIKAPFTDVDSRLIVRANGQYSNDTNLSSIVRYQLGGPNKARAYSPSLFSADDAFYLGVDWVFNSPTFMDVTFFDNVNLRELIKPFVFVDYAYGKQNAIAGAGKSTDVTADITNLGFGLQLSHRNKFKGNLMFAVPIDARSSDPEVMPQNLDNRIIFDFQYSF